MANENQNTAKAEKAEPKKVAQAADTNEVLADEAEQSFPNLVGSLVERVMTNRANLPDAKQTLVRWYAAQRLKNPNMQPVAQQFKRDMETLKLVSESLFNSAIEISYQDM